MSKKIQYENFPTTGKRGQYFYYDDDAPESLMVSDGLPIGLDKFNNLALYSTSQEHELNKKMLNYGLGPRGQSTFRIELLDIANAGVSRKTASTRCRIWVFDDVRWKEYREDATTNAGQGEGTALMPEELDYSDLHKALTTETIRPGGFFGKSIKYRNGRFATWMTKKMRDEAEDEGESREIPAIGARLYTRGFGTIKEGRGLGPIIKDGTIFGALNANEIPCELDSRGNISDQYSTEYAFRTRGEEENIFRTTDQYLYIVVYLQGNGQVKYFKDKKRDRKYEIYKIPTLQFFESDGDPTEFQGSIEPIKVIRGGGKGNTRAPAFKVNDLTLYVNTLTGVEQTFPEEPDIDGEPNTIHTFTDNDGATQTINNYNAAEAETLRDSINEPVFMNLRNVDKEFRFQSPDKYIRYSNSLRHYYTGEGGSTFDDRIQLNFEPVAIVNVLGDDNYDLSAYQKDTIGRQICSAPNQVELGFYISKHFNSGNNELTKTDGFGLQTEVDSDNDGINNYKTTENYKFYVLDWDDKDNKFENPEDYLNDIPQTDVEMLEKQQNNLYKFTSLGETLKHNYSTPGLKIIKALMFSHTKYYERAQTVRWKFIETRIYLDIPIGKFPDFGELGGGDYTTIPWPYTTAVIGGTSENSQYKLSIQNTLAGGKLSEQEVSDIRFLTEAKENDELGQTIQKMDLEQVRYFNTSYDMDDLLNISHDEEENVYFYDDFSYWHCGDWDSERSRCFSEESSVGQIFIDDNLDLKLKENCKLELNTGDLDGKSLSDTNGNPNKGLLIGDYKIKKRQKDVPMRRDSFIKFPKKGNENGAL